MTSSLFEQSVPHVYDDERHVSRRRTPESEIDAQSPVGEVYLASLVRAQLRLALRTLLVLCVLVGAWPLLFATVPSLRGAHVFGLPFPWVLLGVLLHPVLFVLAWWHVRRVERAEEAFSDLVRAHGSPGGES